MGKHRTRLQILANILSVVADNDGAKKTKIMYDAYLSYKLLCNYLSDATEASLLHNSNNIYNITEKGKDFLSKFNKYLQFNQEIKNEIKNTRSLKNELEVMISV